MLIQKFKNCYNLNPPDVEPLPIEDRYDDVFEDLVDEHLYEEKDMLSFIDFDEMRNEKLIQMSQFEENFNGVLSHDGSIKVAKSYMTAKILNIQNEVMLLVNKKKSYTANIHKDLIGVLDFVEVGDTAYIKWRNGECWVVGFRKSKSGDGKK